MESMAFLRGMGGTKTGNRAMPSGDVAATVPIIGASRSLSAFGSPPVNPPLTRLRLDPAFPFDKRRPQTLCDDIDVRGVHHLGVVAGDINHMEVACDLVPTQRVFAERFVHGCLQAGAEKNDGAVVGLRAVVNERLHILREHIKNEPAGG